MAAVGLSALVVGLASTSPDRSVWNSSFATDRVRIVMADGLCENQAAFIDYHDWVISAEQRLRVIAFTS